MDSLILTMWSLFLLDSQSLRAVHSKPTILKLAAHLKHLMNFKKSPISSQVPYLIESESLGMRLRHQHLKIIPRVIPT
jgi:hypothetical protein